MLIELVNLSNFHNELWNAHNCIHFISIYCQLYSWHSINSRWKWCGVCCPGCWLSVHLPVGLRVGLVREKARLNIMSELITRVMCKWVLQMVTILHDSSFPPLKPLLSAQCACVQRQFFLQTGFVFFLLPQNNSNASIILVSQELWEGLY